MIRTFVINLEELGDRWLSIKSQLDNLWINYERFEWTNPSKMSKQELEKIYDEKKSKKVHPPKWLTLWSIWCSDSHLRIYRKIIDENIPVALVFEDDAVIDCRVKMLYDKFNNLWENDKLKRDYLSMNYWFFWRNYLCKYIKKIRDEYFKKYKIWYFLLYLCWWFTYFILDFFPRLLMKLSWKILIVKRYRPFYLTWWYFITKEWARKLLSINDKVFTTADFLINNYRKKSKIKFYITVPVLVEQDLNTFQTTNTPN